MTLTSEWLDTRRQYITGTDTAAICGVSPWKSAFEVWAEKTGKSTGLVRTTEAMEWGIRLEDMVMQVYRARTGRVSSSSPDVWREMLGDCCEVRVLEHVEHIDHKVTRTNKVFLVSKPHAYMACSPDFVVANYTVRDDVQDMHFSGPGMGDVKTTGQTAMRYWSHSGWEERLNQRAPSKLRDYMLTLDMVDWVPPDVWVQVQHNMIVSGLSWATVPVLFGGQQLEVRDIEQDPEGAAIIIDELAGFDMSYLSTDDAEAHPPMSGLDSEGATVMSMYAPRDDKAVSLGVDYTWMEQERKRLGKEIRALQGQQHTFRNEILQAMGKATSAYLADSDMMVKVINGGLRSVKVPKQ